MRVNLAAFRRLVEMKIGKPIEVHLAPDPGIMNGLVLDMDKKAVILVAQRHAENKCWIRMTEAKELMHLYTGLLNHDTVDSVYLAAARDCRLDVPDVREPLHDERFCFFAALETLLPFEWRGQLSDAHHRHGHTNYLIACHCRIPQSMIEYFFDRGYGLKSVEANALV